MNLPNTSPPRLQDILDICLQAMQAGADVEALLKMYPSFAHELRSLLQTAEQAISLSVQTVPNEAMSRSRTRILGRAAEFRKTRKPLLAFFRIPRVVSYAFTVLLISTISLFSLNAASARALPGDPLYPLKRTFETVWLQNPNLFIRQNLQTAYQQRRVDEILHLLAEGRQEQVSFEGVLAQRQVLSGVAAEQWDVNGIRVLIMPETNIVGETQLGMFIAIEGRTEPGLGVIAERVSPRAYAFVGVVETITPQIWQVEGKTVQIEPATEIDSGIVVGDTVMVLARYNESGDVIARAIFRTGSAQPTRPEETPEEEPDPGPTLTITRTPSPTLPANTEPPATLNPSPTHTPAPSATPSPTTTKPGPTDEPEETPEPVETKSEDEDETEEPTETEEPEETPKPTKTEDENKDETEKPTETDEPDETPEPNETDN